MSYLIDFNSSEFRDKRRESYELARSLLINSPDDMKIYGAVVDSCFLFERNYQQKKKSDVKAATKSCASYYGFRDALNEFNHKILQNK